MADRYNNLNNTAPEVDPTKQKKPQIDKSDFDLSDVKYFKILDGMIVPFDIFRVIPNSSYDISYSLSAIMTNPYVKQLLSGKRAYVHVYHSNMSDLWEGAPEFFKKGRDFNTQLKIPTLNLDIGSRDSLSAGSPAAYMGLPVHYYDVTSGMTPIQNIKPIDSTALGATEITDYDNFEFSALPLVMYQQVYQAHYLNKNLINTNTDWLPQVENHFILPLEASGESVSNLSYDVDKAKATTVTSGEDFDFNSELFVPRNVDDVNVQTDSNKPFLNIMRFRQFKGDMFTSGSPFPDLMRGDTPVMSFNDLTGSLNLENVQMIGKVSTSGNTSLNSNYGATPDNPLGIASSATDQMIEQANTNFNNELKKAIVKVQNQISFNLNTLRALDVYTLLGERAARTDGTYNDFIKTMFNVDPHYHMHEPRYLGGFYLDFVNSTIEQTSETSASSPLGSVASRGISKGNGRIGKFTFTDHGYIMAVLDIVDETIYTNGVDRDWTDLTFEQQYLPLFNGLAPQATLQQELFLTGVKADNEDVFNYVERFSHMKSRRNKAVGQMSLPAYKGATPIDIESASYIHSRHFESKVEFNNLFVTMTPKNIDMTPYSSTEDYPFLVTAICHNEAILPLPYITVPQGLAIMA